MLQVQMGRNGLLNLMEGKTEFAPPAQLSKPGRWGPGGNVATNADQSLRQQGDQQFPMQPWPRASVVVFGHVTQLHQTF
ncbi:MAG TPA: hypothetical protein VNX87_04895 [Candidatus Sulfotelmatobacter sp.]|nr:hypothetical protein [Candidatus Sulfotelmatobacter sp.]